MNPNNPIVSVVMPTYNQCQYLAEAIDSVINQTWRDFEFIIVNDGSTDGTYKLLEDYKSRYPEITIINQENKKLPRALNTGFQAAKGEYLTWTSSDNRMMPQMIEKLLEVLQNNEDIGMVYSDWFLINDNGESFSEVRTFDFNRYLLKRINFINASFLYRRACQEEIGLYDPNFMYAEDWEYWQRISKNFSIQRVPLFLYEYRTHSASLTGVGLSNPQKFLRAYQTLANHIKKQDLIGWYWSIVVYKWMHLKKGVNPLDLIGHG